MSRFWEGASVGHGNRYFNSLETNLLFISWNLMMVMMNCFIRMVDQLKTLRLKSSRDHCQRTSLSQISDTLQAGFEPMQSLSSDFVE